jgi:hypothetical protein
VSRLSLSTTSRTAGRLDASSVPLVAVEAALHGLQAIEVGHAELDARP